MNSPGPNRPHPCVSSAADNSRARRRGAAIKLLTSAPGKWVLLLAVSIGVGAIRAEAQVPPASSNYVFPMFVDGTASNLKYTSTLRVARTSGTAAVQCTLTQRNTSAPFTGIDGMLYTADTIDAGFSPASLTALTLDNFLPFETLRTGARTPLKTGYAKLSCPSTVDTQLQFSLSDTAGNKLGEATLLPATLGTSFQFLIDRRDGTRLGFSLVNDSQAEGQFALIARDRFNYEVDRRYDVIEGWSQVSHFVDEELTLPANFVGTVEIIGITGNQSYAVGLQYTGMVFTTIQPIVRNTPLPN